MFTLLSDIFYESKTVTIFFLLKKVFPVDMYVRICLMKRRALAHATQLIPLRLY